MLQDLTRSAIVVPEITTLGRAAKPAVPDLEACSLDNLKELADLAYRTGDQAFAEHCIRRLYALHDQKAAAADRKAGVRSKQRGRVEHGAA